MAPNTGRDEEASGSGKVFTNPTSKKSIRRPSLTLLTRTIEAARSVMPSGPSSSAGSSHGRTSPNNTSTTSTSVRSQDDPFNAYDDPNGVSTPSVGSAPARGGVYSPLVIHKQLTSASAESAPGNSGAHRVSTNLSSSSEPSMRARRFSSLPVTFGSSKKDVPAPKREATGSTSSSSKHRPLATALPLDPKRDWFFCIPVLRKHQHDSSKYARVGVTLLHCRGRWPLRQISIGQNKPVECIAARSREDAMKMVNFGTRELARFRQLAMSRWDFEQVWDAYASPGGRDVPLASLFRLDGGGYYGREPNPETEPQFRHDTVYENESGSSEYGSATSVQIDEAQASVTIEMEPIHDGSAPGPADDAPIVVRGGTVLVAPDDTPMKAWRRLDQQLLSTMARTTDPQFAEHLASAMPSRRGSQRAARVAVTPEVSVVL